MASRTEAIKQSLLRSVERAERRNDPYPHFLLAGIFPDDIYATLRDMPFPVADLGGVSGTREAHNADRIYFSRDNMEKFDAVAAAAEALQDDEVVAAFQKAFGAQLGDTLLRVEYAQDVDGFWLKPHTDIGVKAFTMLIYMSDDPSHSDLGTDIYADAETHVARSPFVPNGALIFVPSDRTWHGFEKRPIHGVRRSLIVNYVTDEWRAREQLSFPQEPVRPA